MVNTSPSVHEDSLTLQLSEIPRFRSLSHPASVRLIELSEIITTPLIKLALVHSTNQEQRECLKCTSTAGFPGDELCEDAVEEREASRNKTYVKTTLLHTSAASDNGTLYFWSSAAFNLCERG